MTKFIATLFAFFCLLFTIGCSDDTTSQVGDDNQKLGESAEVRTHNLINEVDSCEGDHNRDIETCYVHERNCIANPNTTPPEHDCSYYLNENEAPCRRAAFSQRTSCIQEAVGEVGGCFVPAEEYDLGAGDSDQDGISNADEIALGLNPCEVCSYGANSTCDADFDSDNDGVNNGEDAYPSWSCAAHEEELLNCSP